MACDVVFSAASCICVHGHGGALAAVGTHALRCEALTPMRSLSDQPAVVPRRVGVVHTRRHFRKILEARTASNYLTMAETR